MWVNVAVTTKVMRAVTGSDDAAIDVDNSHSGSNLRSLISADQRLICERFVCAVFVQLSDQLAMHT